MTHEERLELIKRLWQQHEKSQQEPEETFEPAPMELSGDTIAGSVED